MTGKEIRAMRTILGLSVRDFAELFSVATRTVYRGEATDDEVQQIPLLHRRLLTVLAEQVTLDLASRIRMAIAMSGGLRGILLILQEQDIPRQD
jgi:predicted transcriptional regulator